MSRVARPGWQTCALACTLIAASQWFGGVAAAAPADDALPPRSEWRASSSSEQVKEQAIAHLIDGDPKTRTAGQFSAGHWFQVDLGRPAMLAGARISWEWTTPQGYTLQTSMDGKRWDVAYRIDDAEGMLETVFFAPREARYLRMESLPLTADWGVSIFEMEPIGADAMARVDGLARGDDGTGIWQSGKTHEVVVATADGTGRQLQVTFPKLFEIAGLLVDWGGGQAAATLESRDASGAWSPMGEDPGASQGKTSYLAAPAPRTASGLRLTIKGKGEATPTIRRLRVLGPAAVLTPMKRYQIVAGRAHGPLFPASTRMQQTYWTVVGVHAGRQKSIFDEYGNLEAFKGASLVQAIWRDADGDAVAADGHAPKQSLREGWIPMPMVTWQPGSGLEIRSEAFAVERGGQPVTLLRHRVRNTGQQPRAGRLSLLVRPMQMNPPWQNGGVSRIEEIAIEGPAKDTAVRINGRGLLWSLTPVDAAGAAPFGAHGESEITATIARGEVPDAASARDADGLAAGALAYDIALAPGEQRDVVLAFPLGTARAEEKTGRLPEAPAMDRKALTDAGFDTLAEEVAGQWARRFAKVGVDLPDQDIVNRLRAQGAYMLINQTGQAMQPGPRNYSRSFIRDGSATAAILLRMGLPQVARDYLRWYSEHAVRENGLVSPILNEDGSVNTWFGSDIEYDSQGEYIGLVADVARLDGGPESVREYLPQVKRAMRFMQELRERTLVAGYMAGHAAPERFRGLIAPSISHEGYSSPTHSYWDDFWALKGWHDGAWLAEALGDAETAKWAGEQGAALRASVEASIRATMAWKDEDVILASADLGDFDPTSISIALDPTGARGALPPDALERTFARYIGDVRKRKAPEALYAYTPYELRNVLTFVHLDQPAVADELLQFISGQSRPGDWHVFAEVIHSRLRFPRYMGDMPHTWIGAEYARAIYGMLMHEGDGVLSLLPGTPPEWLEGKGLSTDALPTAHGRLTMKARRAGDALRLELGDGLKPDVRLRVAWPTRARPREVVVDGKPVTDFDAKGVALPRPFRTLEARW